VSTTLTPAAGPSRVVEWPQGLASSRKLPSYLPWLDVLRFLACFLVIVLHCIPAAPPGVGHAGVALFFSISGFLIGRVLMNSEGLSYFYARRFLRIYPAYFATIALLGLLAFTPFFHNPALGGLIWRNIQYYLTFTFQLSPDGDKLPLLIVWSLCVEELFYLLLPLLFLLRKPVRIAIALAAVVGLLMVPRFHLLPDGSGTWFLFPLNLFFGVCLAISQPKLRSSFPFVAVVAIAVVIANGFGGWFHSFGPVSALLCTATVWSLAVYDGKLPRLFKPVRWMGQLSYGVYLLHLFCVSLAVRALGGLRGHTLLFYSGVLAITTVLAVFAAWILQIAIEDPALRLRPKLRVHPKLKYVFATIQVSLIPVGVALAVFQHLRK
jgi:peptidoglycan/LPS O-acetylase OafA/YrhL